MGGGGGGVLCFVVMMCDVEAGYGGRCVASLFVVLLVRHTGGDILHQVLNRST